MISTKPPPRFGEIVAAWLVRAYACDCRYDAETCEAHRRGAAGERCGCACHKTREKANG